MESVSLIDVIARHAKAMPDKICLIDSESGRKYTYYDLWKASCLFGKRLRDYGLQPGDRVVMQATCSIESFVGQFGIYMAGGVYCPVEGSIKAPRLIEMMKYFDATYVISDVSIDYPCRRIDLLTLCADNDKNLMETEGIPPQDASALSAIIFTTGTTGKAKGVMLSHRNQLLIAKNTAQLSDLNIQDVVLNPLPLYHAGGIRRSHATLYTGGTLVLLEGVIFINKFFQSIEQYGVTSIFLVPAFLAILIGTASDLLKKFDGKLKKISIASSLTTERQKDQLRELLPNTRLFIVYGSTESGNLCSYDFSTNINKPLCIGVPREDANIILMDNRGKPVQNSSKDNPGIISCYGDNVMMGYWHDPILTKSILSGKRLIMADIGYWGQDKMLYILGRRDDVINTGGNKVAPYEIENLALNIPFIKECACVAVPDKVMGKVPKLLVVMEEKRSFSQKDIFSYLSENLEAYKLPRYIEQVESLPKTAELGKVKRNLLTERER